MGKAPAFQFYVKDWLSDPALQSISASSKGIWIDALCYMWEAPERGKLTGTKEEISKLLRATNGDFSRFLDDLKRHKFGDVTFRDNEMTIINRRMFREQKFKENHALRQKRYTERQKNDSKMTPPSSSPSPTAKKENIKRKKNLPDNQWLEELQKKECYSHLNVKDMFQKCLIHFEQKKIAVSRLRFLNWLNKPWNAKPMQALGTQPQTLRAPKDLEYEEKEDGSIEFKHLREAAKKF